jgi:hypothetical protein
MAVKIPQYENRLTPQGGMDIRASAPQMIDYAAEGMSNFGKAAMGLMDTINERANQDDLLRAQTAMVRANEDLQKYSTDLSMSQEPGAYGFADKIRTAVQEYAKKSLDEGQWRPATRNYIQKQYLQLEENLYGHAMNFEAKAGVDLRLGQINSNAQYYQKYLLQNPDKYDQVMTGIDTMIDNAALTPDMKQKLKTDLRQNIALSTAQAIQEKDPALAKQIYDSAYTADKQNAIQLPTDAKLPAGLRNNNPGNIKYANQGDAVGPSVNTDQGDPQAVYATPEAGLNAMYGLALRKFDGGKKTVMDLIAANGGWTPGNQQAAKNIAKTMGVGVNDEINLRDPNQLAKFGRALITQEQGPSNSYINDNQLASAAGSALGGGSVTSSNKPRVTSADLPAWQQKLIQDIGAEKLPHLIASADADINRIRTQYKASVLTQEANDLSMFEDGKVPPKELSLGDYQQAFGDQEGAIRYQNYQSVKTLGNDKLAVKTMSNEQQDQLLKSYEPDSTRPEFYDMSKKRQSILAQAINDVRQERAKDPMLFAMKSKIGDLKPLDFNDMASVGAELSKRYGVATQMNQSYGTPFQVITGDEKTRMLEGFGKLTDQGKIAFLSALSTNLPNKSVYRSIVQQIAPDSPVTAVVGNFVGMSGPAVYKDSHWFGPDTTRAAYDPKQVAMTILQGEQLLNPSKAANGSDGKGTAIKMPKEEDFRSEFDSQMAGAFNNQSKEYNVTYQAVKDYYAAKSAQSGQFNQDKIDTKIFNEAVEAVTGGVTDVNNTRVRRPWGMDETTFNDKAKSSFDAEVKRLGLNWNYSQFGLENSGDGYLVRIGNGYATYKGNDGNLHSVYITIGTPSAQTDTAIPSAGPNSKVDVNKTKKIGTK